jgi:hypothetical protein
MVRVGA